jgi:penicillin-binding protein 2
VGAVTAKDLLQQSNLQPNDLTGKTGLEAAVNDQVQGVHGAEWYEVNALGQKQRLLRQQPAQTGESLATSLDPFISAVAAKAMGDRHGAVVVFDTETGAILSLVSLPSYDPNQLQPLPAGPAEITRRQQVASYLADPNQVLFNRAIAGAYPPGSIFKVVTALAGLVGGEITPSTTVDDTGILKVGDYSYANWYFTQYGRTEGPIQLQRALARSNDIYFYKAAEAIGPTKLADWARRFGLGSQVGLEIAGESAGLVPDPAWKERQVGEKWYLGDTYHFGIGQGDLLVTPVQMAQVLQAVSNRGRLCKLHLLNHGALSCGDLGLTDDQLRPVIAGMIDACSPGGTAFPFFPLNQRALTAMTASQSATTVSDPWQKLAAGVTACKTGTAEFGPANAAGRRATHGWFMMTVATPAQLWQKTPPEPGAQSIEVGESSASSSASQSGTLVNQVPVDKWLDHQVWLSQVHQTGFPSQIGIVVLVESQPSKPFVEGSSDAAPVAKAIYDWLRQP